MDEKFEAVSMAEAMQDTLQVLSFDDIKKYAQGEVVRLSDFGPGKPFVVRLKRPSLMALAKAGKIPNSLLSATEGLFRKGVSGVDNDENVLAEMYDILEIIAESALVEPTYRQFQDAGLELDDKHLIEIFQYTQLGVSALESFRKE